MTFTNKRKNNDKRVAACKKRVEKKRVDQNSAQKVHQCCLAFCLNVKTYLTRSPKKTFQEKFQLKLDNFKIKHDKNYK